MGGLTVATFAPYRAQLLGWLACYSSVCHASINAAEALAHSRREHVVGVSLCVVGALAFISSAADPDLRWPVAQLGLLALIAVLSSCFSGQAWRGHMAAIIAGAACITIYRPISVVHAVEVSWITLVGPCLVAIVSLAWQLWLQRVQWPQASDAPAKTQWWSGALTVDQTTACMCRW